MERFKKAEQRFYPMEYDNHTEALGSLLPGLLSYKDMLLDLIFPPRCAGCGRVDTRWCARCQQGLVNVPMEIIQRRVFNRLDMVSTGWHQGVLQQAVHALKYDGVTELARPLADRLAKALVAAGWPVDIVIPVPLFRVRQQQRGYNQAALLAEATAYHLSLPYQPNLVKRVRHTRSQVGLTREERLQNVVRAFVAHEAVAGQHILLIDDVTTTGATLAACAQSILRHGAGAVYGLTVTTAL